MVRRAVTLIELLVVIAIIAILAAILFPVFTQAKVAAKKTAVLSAQKQASLGIIMYTGDYDDVLPRNDDCVPKGSLNPALHSRPFNASGVGCSTAPFYNRVNHFKWQYWVMPYIKSVDMFKHPGRGIVDTASSSCPAGAWSDCGELDGQFALNLGLTGALNTYGNATRAGAVRSPVIGAGVVGNLPSPSQAMLLLEVGNPNVSFSSVLRLNSESSNTVQNVYPLAIRELWQREFKKVSGSCVPTSEDDATRVFAGGITVGFADGSAKFLVVNKFLSQTPTAAEFGFGGSVPCGMTGGTVASSATPITNINYPMWGLTN